MTMFMYFFCLCPLGLTIKVNFKMYQKWPIVWKELQLGTATIRVIFIDL